VAPGGPVEAATAQLADQRLRFAHAADGRVLRHAAGSGRSPSQQIGETEGEEGWA
jgi:hypothetical protein